VEEEVDGDAIGVEIVSPLIRVSLLDVLEHLFGELRVFSVFNLPEPHQVLLLGAHRRNLLAKKLDQTLEAIDVVSEGEREVEISLQLKRRSVDKRTWLIRVFSTLAFFRLVCFNQVLKAELEEIEHEEH